MHRNENSIHHVNPTDLGILAVALHALEDFSPWVSPSERGLKTAIVATCPVCGVDEPAAVDALRVVQVGKADEPQRLNWFCYAHNGDFRGIGAALRKHEEEKQNLRERLTWNFKVDPGARYAKPNGGSDKVSTLRPVEEQVTTGPKVDRPPYRDPLPDHQADLRCTDPRRIVHYAKESNSSTARLFQCKRCLACRHWRKAHRISDLKGRVEDWATVRRTPALAPAPYAALSRRLRRHGCDFASVPVDAGRTILTNSALDVGDVIAVADIPTAIEGLVGMMVDGGRISGTKRTRKPRQHKEVKWERIGATKLDEAAISRVHNEHGCPLRERDPREAGRERRMPEWDVSSLSSDQLLALWTALGVRITKRLKRNETE